MSRLRKSLPLVYSCSDCSDVAQLANEAAVRIDHAGEAEMSCIAGVGGGVPCLFGHSRRHIPSPRVPSARNSSDAMAADDSAGRKC